MHTHTHASVLLSSSFLISHQRRRHHLTLVSSCSRLWRSASSFSSVCLRRLRTNSTSVWQHSSCMASSLSAGRGGGEGRRPERDFDRSDRCPGSDSPRQLAVCEASFQCHFSEMHWENKTPTLSQNLIVFLLYPKAKSFLCIWSVFSFINHNLTKKWQADWPSLTNHLASRMRPAGTRQKKPQAACWHTQIHTQAQVTGNRWKWSGQETENQTGGKTHEKHLTQLSKKLRDRRDKWWRWFLWGDSSTAGFYHQERLHSVLLQQESVNEKLADEELSGVQLSLHERACVRTLLTFFLHKTSHL